MKKILSVFLLCVGFVNVVHAASVTNVTIDRLQVANWFDPQNTSNLIQSVLVQTTPPLPSSCAGIVVIEDLNQNAGKNVYPLVLSAKTANLPVTIVYSNPASIVCVIDQFIIE